MLFVKKSTLGAIESGCWDTLPHPLYVKGYVKSYASYLGISRSLAAHLRGPAADWENVEGIARRVGLITRASVLFSIVTSKAAARFIDILDACHLAVSGMKRVLLPRF
jgi:hypothetical protein